MFLFLLFILASSNDEVLGSCNIDASFDSPLVSRENFTSPYHMGNTAYFEDGDVIIIKCLQGNKYIDENGDRAICEGENRIRIERTDVVLDFNSNICSRENYVMVRKTNEECSVYGTKLEVGYEILGNFTSIYTVCFDELFLTPLHINYTITDTEHTNETTKSLEFHDNGQLFNNIDIGNLLLKQNETFEELLLFDYITDENYLIPGQLIPYDVLPYTFHKNATLDYTNVVPIWNSLYPVWMSIFNDYFSIPVNPIESEINVGTRGVATLLDKRNLSTELYLKLPRQFPVPKYLYVQADSGDASYGNIIFFFNNDPYGDDEDFQTDVATMIESVTFNCLDVCCLHTADNLLTCLNVTFKDYSVVTD